MEAPVQVDVLVVGAGPAGTAAGITARARGLDALVIDKARFPRDKTCGDGLTTAALRLLEQLGLDVRTVPGYTSVRETVVVGPDGGRLPLPLPADGEYAGVVPRVELDLALVELAREQGVLVRDGVALAGVEVNGNGLRAKLADGTLVQTPFVVAADGHYSFVRRCLRRAPEPELGTWHAFRQYFRRVDEPRMWVLFQENLLPGYAWVFPLESGRANVGFGVPRGPGISGKSLNALWRQLLEQRSLRAVLGPAAEPDGPHRAWPIPAKHHDGTLADGRVLYAGDAAGVVDPLTGEGIAQALESGRLAVEALTDSGPHDLGHVAARYRRSVRKSLGRDLRFASALQPVLASPRRARVALRAAGLTPWTRRNFARWMFEDYPRGSILTPDRWRRGLFTTPGAYPL